MSIELRNVTKRFGAVTAVNNVTFSVRDGELMALLGPSGGPGFPRGIKHGHGCDPQEKEQAQHAAFGHGTTARRIAVAIPPLENSRLKRHILISGRVSSKPAH